VAEYATATPLAARFGLSVEIAVEPEPAGTGGALWHARDRLDASFVLLNGDSWFDINLLDLSARLARNPAALGILALRRLSDAARYGSVSLSGDRIVAFAERPAGGGPGLVSGGIYALRRAVIDWLGPQASLEAAANPARTRDLFFVADGTGGHAFAETYEQHQKNVARLRAMEGDQRGEQKDQAPSDSQQSPPVAAGAATAPASQQRRTTTTTRHNQNPPTTAH